jgi:2-amino-4-hydroxy-6-hydroxymethyldihydropteridine diphosphokinase
LVFISAGSNIEPEKNICRGIEELSSELEIIAISSAIWTPPIGPAIQDEYLNCVVMAQCSIPPLHLKYRVLRRIEAMTGRKRTADRFAPRTLDLDILLFGNRRYDGRRLKIPDPDIYTRQFLPFLISELNPELIMPDTGIKISSLVSSKDFNVDEELTKKLRKLVHSV